MTLKELNAKLQELNAAAKAIIDKADEEAGGPRKGTLTAAQEEQYDALLAEYDQVKAKADKLDADNKRRQRLEDHDAYMRESAGRRTSPEVPNGNRNDPETRGDQPIDLEFRGDTVHLDRTTPEHSRAQRDYHQAIMAYLVTGQPSAGLQTAPSPQGGYLVPTQMSYQILQDLDALVFMRGLATVLPPLTSAASLGVPTLDTDYSDADWTPEVPATDMSEDDALRLGKRELHPHLVAKMVKVSQKLLRTAAVNPETFLRQRLAYRFAATEENAFLTGDGKDKPLGVFVASNDGIPTSRDVTSGETTTFDSDDIINMVYKINARYLANATWLMHPDVIKIIRKFQDENGQYIWQPGLQGGEPEKLLDRPIARSEYAPNTLTAGQYVAILGDFKAGYWIVDSLQLEIQRLTELFALKNQVGFVGRKETDGAPVMASAFARLKLAAA